MLRSGRDLRDTASRDIGRHPRPKDGLRAGHGGFHRGHGMPLLHDAAQVRGAQRAGLPVSVLNVSQICDRATEPTPARSRTPPAEKGAPRAPRRGALFGLVVLAAGDGREMEDGPVDALDDKRAVHHARRDEDHRAAVDDVLLVFQPDLDLAAEVVGVVGVVAEEADDLVAVVHVRPVLDGLGRGLRYQAVFM